MIVRSRKAFDSWRKTTLTERIELLRHLRELMLHQTENLVQKICEVTGKVPVEALASELLPCLELMRYYEKHAQRILQREKRHTPLTFGRARSYVVYEPRGVVAIISPWNYPFQLSVIPVVTALLAGNTVILKPSEYSQPIGDLIGTLFEQASFPPDVLIVLQGGAEVSKNLIEQKPDFIFFTGGVETGKKIMAAAAQNLTPLTLELGGKDPMIVCEDAPFRRSVHAAVYGAFSNLGQICVSVERAYVHESIFEQWIKAVAEETQKLRPGADSDSDISAIIHPPQESIIRSHIDDAIQRGAVAITGVVNKQGALSPVILRNVDHSMRVMKEETFGPVLPVMPFKTDDEALEAANDSELGLNASVWTKDLERGERIARALRVGNCAVNEVIKNIGNPDLPFGGAKHSGFGKIHGPEGLRRFCVTKSIMVNDGKYEREINWFPYSTGLYENLKEFMKFMYAGRKNITWVFRNIKTLLFFRKYFK